MSESGGEVVERLTRENLMLQAYVRQVEAEVSRRDARIKELEQLLDEAGEKIMRLKDARGSAGLRPYADL